MDLADVPFKVPVPFATDAAPGFIRPIPTAPGATVGAASWQLGFPPPCFLPTAAGGIPPSGEDFNEVLFVATAWAQWLAAGAPIQFDSDFAATIGGYPKGAFILSTDATHWWLSKIGANSTDPNSDATNWTKIGPFGNIMSLDAGAGLFISGSTLNAAGGVSITLNADVTAIPGTYAVDTTAGPITVTLSPAVYGQRYEFTDFAGTWDVHPFTLAGGGKNIGTARFGTTPSLVSCIPGQTFSVGYNGSFWGLI